MMGFVFGKRKEAGERELKLDHINFFPTIKRRVVPGSEVIPGPLTKCNSP